MQSLRTTQGHTLIWQQQHAHQRNYLLCAGPQTYASLRWLQAFGSLAQADTSDGQWTFKRVGFWRARITVRQLDAADDLLVFEPTLTGSGTIRLPKGRQLRWSSASSAPTEWAWHTLSGQPLLHISALDGGTQRGCVRIEPEAATLPDLALLASFGWYLTILLLDEASPAGSG